MAPACTRRTKPATVAGLLLLFILAGVLLAGSPEIAAWAQNGIPPRPRIGAAGVACQSTPIALTPDGTRLANVNPESKTLTVFTVSGNTLTKQGEISVGVDPGSVAIKPDNRTAYVAVAGEGRVAQVDLITGAISAIIRVGAEPRGVVVSPNGTRLYVANSSSNTVQVFNAGPTPPSLVATIDVSPFGTAPRGLTVTNDGDADDTDETLFVSLFFAQLRPGKTSVHEGQDDQREGRVVAVSTATNTALGVAVLGPMASTFNGGLGTGFNSNGTLAPGGPPAGNPANPAPAIPSLNPQAFVHPTGAFPNQLAAVAVHPTNGLGYVVGTGASPNGPLRFNHMAQGLVSVFNTSTRAEVISSQTGASVRQTAPLNLNQGVQLSTTPAPRLFLTNPVAMAWRPNGSDAWVAIQQTDLVVRLTVDASGIPTVNTPLVAGPSNLVRVDEQAVDPNTFIPGKAPRGLVINGAGSRAYVSNFVSRSVTVIDISNPTSPAVVGTAFSTALPFPGTEDETALRGAELFYSGRGPQSRMSSEGWGACVVCHPDGRTDNVTWMFDAGPRQTIPLDGTFDRLQGSTHTQRILNWSAVRDENHDFELNTRAVFGGRGLIEDDRFFFAVGGRRATSFMDPTPTDSSLIQSFNQFTGAVSTNNPWFPSTAMPPFGTPLPALPGGGRRDFAMATLDDGRMFIIGGRSGPGDGTLVTGADTVLEFNPRTNLLTQKNSVGFTPRHSMGAAAVRTALPSGGYRIYVIGGYAADPPSASASPVSLVQEYNPATDTWRNVASLPTPVAQFGITTAGGINTAEPLQLIHVVSGNAGSESSPSVVGGGSIVQRFQPDPSGPGTWSAFTVPGLTPRRNHGIAAALRGVQTRIFIIGGQDAGGTVLTTVEEYAAQAVVAIGPTTPPGAPFFGPHPPRTPLPSPRARFGIGSTLTSNQIYVAGGIDGTGANQTSVFEYTPANNTATGTPGTPTGAWVTRANLSGPDVFTPGAVQGLQLSTPPGVTNLLPNSSARATADPNYRRSTEQDAIDTWIRLKVRPARAPVTAFDLSARAGRTLFGTTGLVISGFSCATCHGGPRWTRSLVDFTPPPSPEVGLGLGNERTIGAELRQTATQPSFPGPNVPPQYPGVLINVGTFAPNSAGGRVNELRANPADIGQAVAPLGVNGFNIPSLFSAHESRPYFYSGLAQTLDQVLDGSQDGNGGTRHHFVANPAQRAQLIAFLRSIDQTTPLFP